MIIFGFRPLGNSVAVDVPTELNKKNSFRWNSRTFVLASAQHTLKGPAPWVTPDREHAYCLEVNPFGEIQAFVDPYDESLEPVVDYFQLSPRQA